MTEKQIGHRWWEVVTVLLAVNSVVFGFLFGSGNQYGWAILVGFLPGVLLVVGLMIRRENRGLATILIIASSVAASAAFWMLYPPVLALIVIIGGLATKKIGPTRSEAAIA